MFFDTYSRLCKQKGVSCKKAAMDIGCSGATATRWKNGSIPNGETLKKLAIYFGVTVEYLLNGDEIKKDPSVETEGFSKAQKRLFDMNLSEEEYLEAVAYISARRKIKEEN